MKKIALFICMACVALGMSAQTITGTSQITFRTAGEEDVNLMFVLSNDFSDGWDNSWDAHPAQEGGIYVYYQNAKYSIWASNQYSQNLALGFKATSNTTYRLLFDAFSGVSYTITDLVANHVIAVGASITVDEVAASYYEFEIDNSLKNTAINDRFVINYVPAPTPSAPQVTTNDKGWATFSYSENLIPADGQTLYKGTINGDVLSLDEVDYVKAGEGVLVYGTPSTTYDFAVGNGSDDFSGNDLKATATYSTSMENVFVLKGDAFLEYVGTNALAANKAYIQLPQSGAGAPKRISMRFNQPTAIENVELEAVKAEKFIENGQVLIKRGEIIYNVQGQIVK